ncbi:10986_t:CDS:2, partial [Acaulospora colombiana]
APEEALGLQLQFDHQEEHVHLDSICLTVTEEMSRLDDLEAGVFDSWDEEEEANALFGGDSFTEDDVFHSGNSQGDEDERIRQLCDGLGILEQVGGTSQTAKKGVNIGFNDNVGIGFPPGLHSDMPPPPLSPTKKLHHLQQESQRRPSFYIPRDEPDLEAGLLAAMSGT